MATRNLVLVLGDQLTPTLSALSGFDPRHDVVLMVEVRAEAIYVNKHKQKIAFVLAAMRHFSEALRLAGLPLDYVDFEDPANTGDFTGELVRAVGRHRPERIVVTEPGEWRVLEMMRTWPDRLGLQVEMRGDDIDRPRLENCTDGMAQLALGVLGRFTPPSVCWTDSLGEREVRSHPPRPAFRPKADFRQPEMHSATSCQAEAPTYYCESAEGRSSMRYLRQAHGLQAGHHFGSANAGAVGSRRSST